MPKIISEQEFAARIPILEQFKDKVKYVTGPGRSGSIAGVYASYYLSVPFIPLNEVLDIHKPILIVDTALQTGKTLRKAQRKIGKNSYICFFFNEPPSLRFWYEYHEVKTIKETNNIPSILTILVRQLLLPLLWLGEKLWKQNP